MSREQVAHVRRMLQGLWPWILPPDQVAQRAIRSEVAQMELRDACRCVGPAGRLVFRFATSTYIDNELFGGQHHGLHATTPAQLPVRAGDADALWELIRCPTISCQHLRPSIQAARRTVALLANNHGSAGFLAAGLASDPAFAEGGGAMAAVAALTCALCAAGGVRQISSSWAESDVLSEPTETLLRVPPTSTH